MARLIAFVTPGNSDYLDKRAALPAIAERKLKPAPRQTQPSDESQPDQVGNHLLGDRMIATYGRDEALLGITAVMASPYVPMLFMGEEYGEPARFPNIFPSR